MADAEIKTEQHRMQFVLSPAMHEKLEQLVATTGLATRAEVLEVEVLETTRRGGGGFGHTGL